MNWLKWRCTWPHSIKTIKQNFGATFKFDGVILHKDPKFFNRIVTICIANAIEDVIQDIIIAMFMFGKKILRRDIVVSVVF